MKSIKNNMEQFLKQISHNDDIKDPYNNISINEVQPLPQKTV